MEAPNQVQVEDETGIDRSLDDIMIMDPKDPESRTNETCRDYQRGYCPRGERCWFRHEGAPPSIDTELLAPGVVATLGGRALCRDYMETIVAVVLNALIFTAGVAKDVVILIGCRIAEEEFSVHFFMFRFNLA
eukprot:CAMPEP_0201487316 /NCGR_PEP_ID=MMETSP0151_2-20130828/12211_1 /ASSEMBLY_ACC=CAM_ASM_000257 /TAXON_ID=200890 /ORGANISM="Paramoeba atlantica, Strain 621/1 / CCAP 1560/9" /LENGTH=132 /DNA_ID=CAMNT_0047872317 /DNA_START=177 /DNA_END=572 /DNA_ORIENTATION=-